MITINLNTKIGVILKAHPDALEAIISSSPNFNRLRNPLLRKIMASRTTISMASKIGGCLIEDIFSKLEPFGFKIDRSTMGENKSLQNYIPDFIKLTKPENTLELDVRPIIEGGNDPLKIIKEKLKEIKTGQLLKLINSFEPSPLIALLANEGYKTFVETINENLVFAYFYKSGADSVAPATIIQNKNDWENILKQFKCTTRELDVRQMEMPKPMLAILKELENLPKGNALLVYHKRIPVFLLSELAEQNFDYSINEIADDVVNMLIFHKLSNDSANN